MIRFLPVKMQAIFWCLYARKCLGHTSHYRIEAVKRLRKSAKIPLKDADKLIRRYMP